MQNLIKKTTKRNLLTVNWHLEKDCNYKCKFCFAHFEGIKRNLNQEESYDLITMIKDHNIYKINFAGGEPLLNQNVGEYIKYAKDIDLKTSIISNGSKMSQTWLKKYLPYLDVIGISCDSLCDQTNKEMGRGFGHHFAMISRLFERINTIKQFSNTHVKLNTVVYRQNLHENWVEFIQKNNIDRWKVFKILKIENENDEIYDSISITDEQFKEFLYRHLELNKVLVPENNDNMINSYLMITPDGRFYSNNDNILTYSDPILDIGIEAALEQTMFEKNKFVKRGGSYSV